MSKLTEHQSAANLQAHPKDTGTSEVQITFLTNRIESLTAHFKTHAKDFSGRRGLLSLVGKRRSLLAYLKKTDKARYAALLTALDLRH